MAKQKDDGSHLNTSYAIVCLSCGRKGQSGVNGLKCIKCGGDCKKA